MSDRLMSLVRIRQVLAPSWATDEPRAPRISAMTRTSSMSARYFRTTSSSGRVAARQARPNSCFQRRGSSPWRGILPRSGTCTLLDSKVKPPAVNGAPRADLPIGGLGYTFSVRGRDGWGRPSLVAREMPHELQA
jgi:hypothetical protein